MASGESWQDWVEKAIACPPEWDFGTRMVIEGREWICMDRGSQILVEGGVAWIDMLTPSPLLPYGTVVEAEILP